MDIFIIIGTGICVFFLLLLFTFPLFSYLRYRFHKAEFADSGFLAPVSIIIACFNEENYLKNRIEYFLNKDNWIDGSELIIISTGSTDETNKILRQFDNDPRIRIIVLDERISKIKTLNRFVPEAKNEIIIFSDCRQEISTNAVRNLIRHFNSEDVSTVSATLQDTKDKEKPSIIRSVLNKIAFWESRSSSSLNLFGALYAQRKCDFRPFPENLLFDDLFVVVSVLQQRKRLIQDPEVIIRDISFEQYYQKDRIERLVRGLLLFLFYHWKMIFSLNFGDCYRFLGYKYMKLLMPFLFLFSFAVVFIKFNSVSFLFVILIIALLVFLYKPLRDIFKLLFRINHYFAIAVLKFIFFRKRSNTWKPLQIRS